MLGTRYFRDQRSSRPRRRAAESSLGAYASAPLIPGSWASRTFLFAEGPWGLCVWQWIALPIALAVAWGCGYGLSRLSRRLLASVVSKTEARWDDALLRQSAGPLTLGWMLGAFLLLTPWLELHTSAQELVQRILHGGFLLALLWGLARSIDVVREVLADSTWAKEHHASRSLLPLGARVGKVVVGAMALVAMISELGYPVASLLAGLGLGGLAFALAAQKTVENLFGAFSIGADQPFREGDFVRVEDCLGTIESVGLRSTRLRTLDRTMVTIPNGKLAEMRTETFGARDRIRLACTIGLVYATTADQIRNVLTEFERTLREHPQIWPDNVVVRFKELGASSLDVEVMAWFATSDWGEFQSIRQEVLLKFMEIVEHAGTSFAFPTRTVHVVAAPS